MKEFPVTSSTTGDVFKRIPQMMTPGVKYILTLVEHEKRTKDANAQMHVWTKIVSQHTGEDIKTVQLRNKRDFGLPLLLANGTEYASVVSYMLTESGYYNMTDARQLKMIDAIEVTRRLSTKDHNALRDNMQAFWEGEGLILSYK